MGKTRYQLTGQLYICAARNYARQYTSNSSLLSSLQQQHRGKVGDLTPYIADGQLLFMNLQQLVLVGVLKSIYTATDAAKQCKNPCQIILLKTLVVRLMPCTNRSLLVTVRKAQKTKQRVLAFKLFKPISSIPLLMCLLSNVHEGKDSAFHFTESRTSSGPSVFSRYG